MASSVPLNSGDIETGNGAAALAAAGIKLPPEPELKGPLKPVQETTPRERGAGVMAAFAVISSVVAMIIEGENIVYLAGILSIVLGPYAYFQQTRLTDIAMLQETAAVIQEEVEKLKTENIRLTKYIDDLGNTIDDLQDVEAALDVISNTQGQSVSALEKQVQENKDILSKMKKSTKGRVIQNLISIIYRGDENLDDVISDAEATKVMNNLSKIAGLTVHEQKLREAITGKSVEAVIDVVKNLLGNDVPDDQKIFEVKE